MTAATTAHPTWRHWAALLLLGLPVFMMATDFTAIFLALPAMSADLAPSTTQTLWIVHIGELVTAGALITMGWLTGRLGPRALVLLALTLYLAASVLAAYAPSAEVLLIARVLIGMATAAASPAALAMLRVLFTRARHYGIGFAVVMGAFPVGVALGPPLTGMLLEYFWWGSAFLVNAPVAALALLGGLILFPRSSERTADRIDLVSVALSMGAVMLAVYGLQEIADQGFTLPYASTIVMGVALGTWFIRRQRRIANPLLDLNLFAIRILRLLTVFFLLVPPAFMAVDFVLVQYLQVVQGVPVGTLGFVLAVPGIAAIGATAMTPLLTRRFTPRSVMAAGVGIALIGTGGIVVALVLFLATPVIVVGLTLTAVGMSPPLVLGAQLMITSVPQRQTGPAAALQDISASLGNAVGIGVLGSLAMAVFGRGLRAGAPTGLSRTDLDSATESLGGAVAVAEAIGEPAAAGLADVIDIAWSHGTLAAYTVAFAFGLVLLVAMLRGLRGVQLPDGEVSDGEASDGEDPHLAPAQGEHPYHEEPALVEATVPRHPNVPPQPRVPPAGPVPKD